MKSWADHCSSDEESIDGLADELKAQKFADAAPSADGVEGGEAGAEESFAPAVVGGDAPPAGPRVYDFPDKPPFTAFIGNLAYSLKDPEELKAAVAKCALDNLGQEINILGARISFGRDGKHRGFGYLELETLDQLKTLMQLNDGEGTVAGRKVQLDTANGKTRDNNNNKRGGSHQQRRNHGDGGNIDGSRFRGGKFNNSDRRNNGNSKDGGGGPAPPGERPSLKLAPRTKKVEDAIDGQGSANIFGGAKARDAQAWEEKRGPKKHRENNGEQNKDNNDRRRSQGGRGRGAAEGGRGRGAAEGGRGRSSGSGRGGAKGETNGGRRGAQAAKRQAQQNMVPPEERAAAAAAKAAAEAAAAPAAPAKPQVPANKFALLMDSDSE